MPSARRPMPSRRLAAILASALALAATLPLGGALAKDPVAGHTFLSDAQTAPRSGTQILTAAAAALPAGFSNSVIFDGLAQPTKVVFGPDGKVWVLEKAGRILYYPSLATTTPVVFADLRSEVNSYWDRGLMGLAVSPDYAADHAVYVQYAWDHNPVADIPGNPYGAPASWNDGCPANPGSLTDGCAVLGRIAKLTATPDGASWSGAEQVLVSGWCQQFPSHSNDDLRFGPDGYLYATAGDGASFVGGDYGQLGGTQTPIVTPANPCGDPPSAAGTADTAPAGEGGGLRAQSVRRTDGPADLNGALLRIDPATGNGVPGNPFYSGDGSDNASRILAYGFRNPFRFTFRPGQNEAWVGDVGYNTWEEIDRLALPPASAVRNFGWPCVEGNQTGTYYGGTAVALCTGLSGTAAPYFTYSHGSYLTATDSAAAVCPPGSSSISGDAFYAGNSYPATYQGALFFADHSRQCLWAMLPNTSGVPDPAKITTLLSGVGPVDVESGPNGDIFWVDFDAGTINRIAYDAPQPAISSDVTSGNAPLVVHFDGTGSSGGVDTLAYAWTVPGGTCDSLTSAIPTCSFGGAGVYSTRLTVTDTAGASTTSSPYPITVGGASPPTVSIDAINGGPVPPTPALDGNGFPPPMRPAGFPAIWAVGDGITFAGHATDSDGHAIAAAGLTWQVDILHCPSNCHTHAVQTFAGTASGSFTAPDHDYPSLLRLTLRATDSHGLWSTTTAYLYPKTATMAFTSTPSGLALTAGTVVNATAPFSATFMAGGHVIVNAGATQALGAAGQSYAFASWSDGGAPGHTVSAVDGRQLTARYTQIQTNAYLSDLTPIYSANGWGPYERDMSNGEQAAGDGQAITVGGVSYAKGLGVHALSDLRYGLGGTCDSFTAIAGLDAEAHGGGAVDFQVWLDGVKAYDSGTITGTATKSVKVATGGAQQIRLVVAPANDGNSDHADWANARILCGAPPTATAPVSRLYVPATLGGTTSTSVLTSWSATDANGVASYELQRQVNGGGWAAVALSSPTATSLVQSLSIGATYRYRVRATDGLGNTSAWLYGRTMKALLTQDTSTSVVKYHGTWHSLAASSASGGRLHYATARGAYVTYTFSGSSVAWVAYKGPIYGSARVYIDGHLKATVSLYATKYASKPTVYTYNWGSDGTHTVKVYVLGTSGHARVALDAFVRLYLY